MSDSSSDQKIFGAKWAFGMGASLLVGLAGISALALGDHKQLASLETTESNTAVGDTALFPLPTEPTGTQHPLLKFGGKDLFAAKLKKAKLRDSQMIRQGRDDSNRFAIYSSSKPLKPEKGEVAPTEEVIYFVKLAPGEYLKLSTTPPSSKGK